MSQILLVFCVLSLAAAAWQGAWAWSLWQQRRMAAARAAGLLAAPRLGGWAGFKQALQGLQTDLEAWLEQRWSAANALNQRLRLAAAPQRGAGQMILQGLMLGALGTALLASLELGPYSVLGLGLALLPGVKLRDWEARRKRAVSAALPDALDLLCTCVQAGQGLDQALQRAGSLLPQSPLRDEWLRSLEQIRTGASREQAFEDWERRCASEDLGALLRAILRSERRGVPLGPVLQASSEQLRRLRSLRIQEEAAKAPIKMLLPLMLFFLPAVFLILFGPILLKLSQSGF